MFQMRRLSKIIKIGIVEAIVLEGRALLVDNKTLCKRLEGKGQELNSVH